MENSGSGGNPVALTKQLSTQEVVNWAVVNMMALQENADFHGQEDTEFGWNLGSRCSNSQKYTFPE